MGAGVGGGVDGTIELTATGEDEPTAVAAALAAVLAAARGPAPPSGTGAASAAAIRGQGAHLPHVVAELVNDLLAQLDAHGAGLGTVRLDGLLRTEDGFTAWGYALGSAADPAGPVAAVSLPGPPTVEREGETTVLRIRLRRD